MPLQPKKGWLEVIVGPMFAGKTEELLRRIRRLEYARQNVVVFKPGIDDRYDENSIISHNKTRAQSINIDAAEEIFDHIDSTTDVVAIDEVQFLDDAILDVIDFLVQKGKVVMTSGLDLDFRGEPFSFVPILMARAEYVMKLSAVCVKCGAPATRTQRIIDGKPAKYYDPVVMIGASESYEARCRHCHKVYRKPAPYKNRKGV
ncbi:MAG: thymidine kinase [Candidatus Izemoplasmataceae bacterium]